MNLRIALTTALAAAALATSAQAQTTSIDECGTMANDGGGFCLVFIADSGDTYLPSTSLTGLMPGDRVRFTGDVDPFFVTICWGPFAGMLINDSWSFDPTCDATSGTITIGCDPASDHYGGDYVKLDGSAFGSGVGSDLHLDAQDGPDGEFGFFLVSAGGSNSLALFNGVLCLDSPQGRYNPQVASNQGLPQLSSIGQFDASGDFVNLVGTSTSGFGYDVPLELPFTPTGQVIAPGETWYFQCWYRDQIAPLPNPGSSANFSNMAEVTFP